MNDDSCSCLLFLTPIDVLQKSLYPESLPSFSRLGCGGLRFPFCGWGLGGGLGMAWKFSGGCQCLLVGVLGWLSAVFKGPDEFNDEDDGGAQEDEEVAQVEYYFFEPSVLNAEVIYYVVADQSVVKVAGSAA